MNIHIMSPLGLSLLLALSCSGTLHFGDTRDDSDGGAGPKGQAGAGMTTGGPSTPDSVPTTDAAGPVPPSIDGQGGGPVCTAIQQHEPFVRLPIDLYFMFDRSGSMATVEPGVAGTRMVAVQTAIEAFLRAPASAWFGAGIAFFPFIPIDADGGLTPFQSCEVADYASAVVEIGDLPANAQTIRDAIGASEPLGATPALPALQGAVQYATARMSAHPERTVAIVLVTDGEPTGCQSTIDRVSEVAAAAFARTPRLRTFVLGVGPSTGNLDAIAAAGGTWKAFMATSSAADELSKGLNSIRAQMTTSVSCTYRVPAALSTLDYEAAKIATSIGATGTPRVGIRIASHADCDSTSDGWYFDDIERPTTVTLCPATCEPLAQESGSSVSIAVSCKAPVSVP
ncbi:MAG TPA: vWA domain-containing protein [Polyangiaceae bacterium]|nr:vWA domain-containing protein [Polyangiaceae bacterium]